MHSDLVAVWMSVRAGMAGCAPIWLLSWTASTPQQLTCNINTSNCQSAPVSDAVMCPVSAPACRKCVHSGVEETLLGLPCSECIAPHGGTSCPPVCVHACVRVHCHHGDRHSNRSAPRFQVLHSVHRLPSIITQRSRARNTSSRYRGGTSTLCSGYTVPPLPDQRSQLKQLTCFYNNGTILQQG